MVTDVNVCAKVSGVDYCGLDVVGFNVIGLNAEYVVNMSAQL